MAQLKTDEVFRKVVADVKTAFYETALHQEGQDKLQKKIWPC